MNSKQQLLEERKKKFYDDKHIDAIKQEIEAEVFSNSRIVHNNNTQVMNSLSNNSIYMIRPIVVENNNRCVESEGNINSNANGTNSSWSNTNNYGRNDDYNNHSNIIHHRSSNSAVDDRGMLVRGDIDDDVNKVDMITKNNDLFLNRLTEKLTKHIRNELNNQFMNEGTTTPTSVINDSHNISNGKKSGNSIRDLMSQHMDLFLESELSTHTCKICFELMIPPIHTPILLFPCGHTFCKCCMDKHISSSSSSSSSLHENNNNNSRQQLGVNYSSNHHHRTSSSNQIYRIPSSSSNSGNSSNSTNNNSNIDRSNIYKKGCPYCRVIIESRAINQSLKELIEQFSKQRGMIQDTSVRSLEQIFPVHHNQNHHHHHHHNNYRSNNDNQSNHSNIYNSSSGKAESDADRFSSQLKSCQIRHSILMDELNEVEMEEQVLMQRKKKITKAKEHLLEEKEKIEMKLSLLLEEKELVVKHLDDQDAKYRDIADVENSLHQRAKIVKNTVNNLQLEIEKLRILLRSTDDNHHNDDECGRGDCV